VCVCLVCVCMVGVCRSVCVSVCGMCVCGVWCNRWYNLTGVIPLILVCVLLLVAVMVTSELFDVL